MATSGASTKTTPAAGAGSGGPAAKAGKGTGGKGKDASAGEPGGGKGTAGQGTAGQGASGPRVTDLSNAVPLAVDVGWCMGVLFGEPFHSTSPVDGSVQLPSEHELAETDRNSLELVRLSCLLTRLEACIAPNDHPLTVDVTPLTDAWEGKQPAPPAVTPAPDAPPAVTPAPVAPPAVTPAPVAPPAVTPAPDATPEVVDLAPPAAAPADPEPPAAEPAEPASRDIRKAALRQALISFNLQLLEELACAGREIELAYQLGRSLRDTVSPPHWRWRDKGNPDAAPGPDRTQDLVKQLARGRITRIQEWLATLTPHLPPNAAAVVGASMGRWSDAAAVAFDPSESGRLRLSFLGSKRNGYANDLLARLLSQGDVWLYLLTGDQSTDGLLTPEANVAAGEAALNRSARIVWKVVRHYWVALAVVLAALGGVMYFAYVDLGGAGRAWTQIAAIASALGVTGKGIGSTVAKLAREGGHPVYVLEEQDAMAWAVTTLPPVRLTHRGVRALRKKGIAASGPLGRV